MTVARSIKRTAFTSSNEKKVIIKQMLIENFLMANCIANREEEEFMLDLLCKTYQLQKENLSTAAGLACG